MKRARAGPPKEPPLRATVNYAPQGADISDLIHRVFDALVRDNARRKQGADSEGANPSDSDAKDAA